MIDSNRASESSSLAWLLVILLLTATSRHAEAFQRLRTLGDQEVSEIESYSHRTLLPRQISCTGIEVLRGALHDINSDGELAVRLRWGDTEFLDDLRAENSRRSLQGLSSYDAVPYASAIVTIQVPAADGNVKRLVRTVSLPVGHEETVAFALDSADINLLVALADQASFSPPVLVDATWRDVDLTLTVQGKPSIVKPPDLLARKLTVRLPAAFHLPPDLYLEVLRPAPDGVDRFTFGGPLTEIVAASNADLPYRVVQPTGSAFNNTISGVLPKNLVSATLDLAVHSHNVTLDQTELAKIETDVSYLVLWLRDADDSVWVAYSASFDRERGRTFQIVHREGSPLLDGLLLGFNNKLQLTQVYDVSSESLELDDSLLTIQPTRIVGNLQTAPSQARGWLNERVHTRVAKSVTTERAEKSPALVRSLISEVQRDVLDSTSVATIASARSAVVEVNAIDADRLAQRQSGYWYGILLHSAATWEEVAPLLTVIGPVAIGSGPQGDTLREEILSLIERLKSPGVDGRRQLFQLLLSHCRSSLSLAQRHRYWSTLDGIVVPRDASLDEGFQLLRESKVYLDSAGILRPMRRTVDKLSVDLSGLSTRPDFTAFTTNSVVKALVLNLDHDPDFPLDIPLLGNLEQVNLSFEGAAVQDSDLTFLSLLKSADSLTLNFNDTSITGQGLAHLRDIPHLRRLSLTLEHCANLRADSLAVLEELSSLRWLDLDIEGDRDIGDAVMARFEHLTSLSHVSLNLVGTSAHAALPFNQTHAALADLSVGLPRGYDPLNLSHLQQVVGLKRLWVRSEPGSDSDGLVVAALRNLHVQELHLTFVGTTFTDAGLDALVKTSPARVLTGNFQFTGVTSAHAAGVCAGFAGDAIEIELANDAGCRKPGR